MTISSETNKSGPYTGNGVTVAFAYGFSISNETHLLVISTSALGVETVLTIATNYTVSGVGAATGTVTMIVAPATGTFITLIRDVPFTQELDLQNQGAYFAENIEAALDAGAARDQQLKELVDRSVKLPASANAADLDALVANINSLAGVSAHVATVAGISASVVTVAGMAADVVAVPAAVIATNADVVSADAHRVAAAASAAAAALSAGANTDMPTQIAAATDEAFADTAHLAARKADGTLIKRTWLNFKALLKTYFDTLYQPVAAALISLGGLAIVAGDLVYGSGVNTLARLAKATDGMVLTLVSGLPAWATAVTGGWTQIGGTVNTTSGTTVTISSIPAGYRQFFLRLQGLGFTASAALSIAVSFNNGGAWSGTSTISGATGSAINYISAGFVLIDAQTGNNGKYFHFSSQTNGGVILTGGGEIAFGGGALGIDAIQLSGGTFDSGSVTLWGIK